MDGRAGRHPPPHRDWAGRAHRRGHRPCPPHPPHRLIWRPTPLLCRRRETTMPSTTRRDRRGDTPPPRTGSRESEALRGFLDYLRTSIAAKVDGAPEPQRRTAAVPSGTNRSASAQPPGLGRALDVPRGRRHRLAGDVPSRTGGQRGRCRRPLPGRSQARQRRSRRCTDLAAPVPRPPPDRPAPCIHWALTHMNEETGRHAGHADILRELINGTTGH
ncbi:mycothiol transferase [Streptomyces shenzhenensis]